MTSARVDRARARAAVQAQIACTSYSGSTLLGLLLARQPGVVFTSQLGDLSRHGASHQPCSCGAPLDDCAYWQAIAARAGAACGRAPADLVPQPTAANRADESPSSQLARKLAALRPTPSALRRVAARSPHAAQMWRSAEAIAAIAAAVADHTGAQAVVDATKYDEITAARAALDGELRVIHLVRDARGVVASRMRRRGATPAQAARTWTLHNLRLLAITTALPQRRVLRLRYEDLCADPLGGVRAVLRFVGVADAALPTEVRLEHHDRHLVGGNPMRLDHGVATIALDERWRRALDARALWQIRVIAGALNRAFGYR